MNSTLKTNPGTLQWAVGNLVIDISENLQLSPSLCSDNSVATDGIPFVALRCGEVTVEKWTLDTGNISPESIRGPFGVGERLRLTASDNRSLGIEVKVILDLECYASYPEAIFSRASFESQSEIPVDRIVMNRQSFDAFAIGGDSSVDAWIYNGSGETREHHIHALCDGYEKRNYLGLLESFDGGGHQPDYRDGSQPGYGGGVPMVDVWSRKLGMGIGHVDTAFRYIELPVRASQTDGIDISLELNPRGSIHPNRPLRTIRCFLNLHTGDYFNGLNFYREVMESQGLMFNRTVAGSYEPQWDTWGFNADFSMDDVRETLPYLKDIGIKWLTLDDRWFDVNGDWQPRLDTFPEGEASLISFIEELHQEGFMVRLWTIPCEFDGKPDLEVWQAQHPTAAIELAKHPFHAESLLYKDHPDWMIASPSGDLEYSKRGNYFGAGNLPQVQGYFRELTRRMFLDWKIDGLKQDAVYMAPQDYNPDHGLFSPDDAGDGYVAIMKTIYETALECNPDAVILNCPCGTPMTPQWMTWQNQAVTVDPWTSWVNRGVLKEMKGLFGPCSPVVLDHIEISDEGEDFSILGTGGVPATRFTPSGRDRTNEIEDRIFDVRPFEEKLKLWKHWFGLYNKMRLSEGEYLNLYDIIYDQPETHVIRKPDAMYFSLYPGVPDGVVDDGGVEYREKKHLKKWKGEFSFRGLDETLNYQVRDWENNAVLGTINGASPKMELDIDHHLLLELTVVD